MIIVGATHGATAGYRADADVAYAEARKYTSNVIKVYSPNATWAKVKAAVVGASIVIYMGHGNGWPSPYTYDPLYTTKDGFGLNATAGAGDYNNKYYGEPYIATLDLAPGAIVLLHHLCYASGNSEPGNAEPSVTVARQRADNYAAGFLKAGASAVIADGHAGAESYLRALFTTHQSIEDLWRTDAEPERQRRQASRRCGRPASHVFQDPITPTSGFYRSLAIGTIGVTTDEVISAGYGDTGANPTSLVVPGNAEVSTDGRGHLQRPRHAGRAVARRFPPGRASASSSSPTQVTADGADARRRSRASTTRRSAGFMVATDLAPRDSAAPIVRALEPGGPFSPNGDGAGRHDDHQRPLHRDRRLDAARRATPAATSSSRRPARGTHVQTRLGRAGRRRAGPGRHLHGQRQRRRRLGQRAGQRDPLGRGRHPRPDARRRSPRRRHDPVVRPERRRLPRHGLGRRDERRDRERSIVRVLDAGGGARQEVDGRERRAPPRR